MSSRTPEEKKRAPSPSGGKKKKGKGGRGGKAKGGAGGEGKKKKVKKRDYNSYGTYIHRMLNARTPPTGAYPDGRPIFEREGGGTYHIRSSAVKSIDGIIMATIDRFATSAGRMVPYAKRTKIGVRDLALAAREVISPVNASSEFERKRIYELQQAAIDAGTEAVAKYRASLA